MFTKFRTVLTKLSREAGELVTTPSTEWTALVRARQTSEFVTGLDLSDQQRKKMLALGNSPLNVGMRGFTLWKLSQQTQAKSTGEKNTSFVKMVPGGKG